MFEAGIELVERGLALIAEQDISAVAPLQLGADIKRIRGVINRAEAQCVRRVEVFDREDAYASSGDTSTTSWLRNNCQLSGFSADKHVKLARQLPELRATQKALESGQIGIEHALEVARATDDMGPAAEAELLSAARTKDPAEVRLAAKEIRHRVDAAGMARQAMERFRKRRLHLIDLPDGMIGLEGALPPEGGVALKLTLESLTGVPPKGDERTQQQRHADALMELCRRQLDSGTLPSINGRKPHLTVVVQAETLAGAPGAPAAQLEGAGPISGETAKRLLCGGSASVLTADSKGAALDLGRSQRLGSEPQRRVLAARDKGCVVPGCNWEARFCDVHHLDEWALGGGTRVRRMVLLCKVSHHPLVHEGGWKLAENEDRTFALVPPWEQPRAG
ncbi:MAG TPA: DUF222 domain-containing protein [Candidatus Dormibacteraeota bacterium]|jgi:hypothetical protein